MPETKYERDTQRLSARSPVRRDPFALIPQPDSACAEIEAQSFYRNLMILRQPSQRAATTVGFRCQYYNPLDAGRFDGLSFEYGIGESNGDHRFSFLDDKVRQNAFQKTIHVPSSHDRQLPDIPMLRLVRRPKPQDTVDFLLLQEALHVAENVTVSHYLRDTKIVFMALPQVMDAAFTVEEPGNIRPVHKSDTIHHTAHCVVLGVVCQT